MPQSYLLGLDVGGGSGRCLLLDVESGESVVATRSYRHPVAPGTGGLGADLDLDALWRLLCEAVREALTRADARPEQVIGMAASAMRFATVLLGRGGETLLATPNRDARAGLEALRLHAEHGPALHARMGHWPSPIFAAPRLAWLRGVDADALARSEALLGLGDWVTWRLCGELVPEPTQAPATLLYDVTSGDWAWDWIDYFKLPSRMFRELALPGTPAGRLLPAAAAALGLRPGLPVAVCGADTPAGLLGAGVAAIGEIGVIAGTTSPVQLVLDQPVVDPEGRLWTGHHLVPNTWALESNGGTMGEALDWFARLVHPAAARPVSRFLAEAAASEPGAAGLLSSLGANVMDAREMRLPIGTLTLCHLVAAGDAAPRRHVARSVVEGMACALRANVEQVEGVAARRASTLRLGGGMSRSGFFAQLLCDVLARPIEVSATPEASALGAALCAGVAAGAYPDLGHAAAAVARRGRRLEPDAGRAQRYESVYASWSELHARRRGPDAFAAQTLLPSVLAPLSRHAAVSPVRFRPRIVVTADLDRDALAGLSELGEVEAASFRDAMRLLTGSALVEALRGAAVFVTEIDVLDAAALAELPELRVVVACRGEAVNVDVEACTAFGIPVLHAPGRNAEAVADLTLAFLLMLSRRIPEATGFLRQPGLEAGDLGRMGQAFRTLRGRELWRKRVGLVGLGAVGRAVAQRLAGFGVELLVHDPFVATEEVEALGGTAVTLDALLAESDFVSLHAAASDATRGLLGAKELARMKPGAALVNTARAALVDEDALVDALKSGRLAGAALDVFAVEPPGADHPLLALPNVIATPHVGGNTEEVSVHQGLIVLEDLARLLRGERPRCVLNPDTLAAFDWEARRSLPDAETLAALSRRAPPAVSDLKPAPRATSPPNAPRTAVAASVTAAAGRMKRVLLAFCAFIESDPRLREVVRGREATLQFALPDLELEFFLQLADGVVRAGLGPAERAPDVRLRMKAHVLDGMFTGRVSGMDMAMKGELFFTGDAARAMTLQHLQADLQRLYAAARADAGDPGDLSGLAAEEVSLAAVAVAADDPRVALIEIVRELHGQNVITATGGNVSVRVGDELWITPSQLYKGDLRPELLVRIGLDGEPIDAATRSPSSERLMHCAAYLTRPEARAVIHAHAPNATVLANAELPFLPISTEAAFFGEIPRIPFIMPGTKDLADAIAGALADSWAVLMQNHGLLVAGRSLRRAADMVEIIERTAEVLLRCRAVGREPPLLPDDVVRQLRQMGDLVA
jgi:autoinducer 2 (AI-2) kinase